MIEDDGVRNVYFWGVVIHGYFLKRKIIIIELCEFSVMRAKTRRKSDEFKHALL